MNGLYNGIRKLAAGVTGHDAPRVDDDGSLVSANQAAVEAFEGRYFMGMTAVTGVAPGTAIGTTAAFALYNPIGSPVDVIIVKARMGYVSGTLGIGRVDWVGHVTSSQAAFSGTAIVAYNGRIGNPVGYAKPLTTATVPAGGVVLRPAFNLPPMLATTVLTPWIAEDNVNGAIVLPPGLGVTLQATAAAGTSPLVVYGIEYIERPRV